MPDFRRGLEGMNQAQNSGSPNPFPGFVRGIIWTKDREEKFIAFLNHAIDMPTVAYHPFIEVGKWKNGKARYEEFISRTDPGVGEDSDEITDRLGRKSQQRTLAVAVELEATYTTVNNRKRPTGFAVKTETFERKKEDGSTEEVEAPVIGMVVQSPRNFFGWVGSFDETTNPIEEVPLQVTRQGKDAGTVYNFVPFLDQPIDYTNLIDLIGNVSYLRDEEVDTTGEQRAVALGIGTLILDKRLAELTDKERYERMVGPIDQLEDKWGNDTPAERPQRPSQRTAPAKEEKVEPEEAEPEATERNSKFDELRKMHESV